MIPDFVHILLVGVAFTLLLQHHLVYTMECGTVNFVRPAVLGGSGTIKAAHCIQKKRSVNVLSPHEVVVRLGAYNLTNPNETGVIQRNVSAIFIHDDWDAFGTRFDADISILVLSEDITFTDGIQPVCMPANGVNENMEGSVVGYGVRKRNIYAEAPRRIIVRAVNSSHCFREDDVVRAYSSERTFCGGNGDGSPDLGDSGSGYFFTPGFSWAQYGIVAALRSNDTGHVFPYAYHVYTNLTTFKDWIIKTVNETGGVVGEARMNIIMSCDYGFKDLFYSDLRSYESIYSCTLYNIDIQGNNFETSTFNGSHLNQKKQNDVEGIHFSNGTMFYLPSGFGSVFANIDHLIVGQPMSDSGSLSTKVVRRSDLRNLRKLTRLIFFRNDIEKLHEDALWDLPNLQTIKLIENKLTVLFNETFSKNRMLMEVVFRSNQLSFLPANLFRNNPMLLGVDFRGNFLKMIDENFFTANRRLRMVELSSNRLEMLPKRLFQKNLSLVLVTVNNNALSSIDEDLFEANMKLEAVKFSSNRIESVPRTLFRNNLRLYGVEFINNSITAIDENLFIKNKRLNNVSFGVNRLEHLHRNLFKNNSLLNELILTNNRLTNIDIDFAEMEQIGGIDLRGNDCINAVYERQNIFNHTGDAIFGNLEEFQRHVIANCNTIL